MREYYFASVTNYLGLVLFPPKTVVVGAQLTVAEPLVVYERRTFICPCVDGLHRQIAVVFTGVTRLHPGIIFAFS